MAEQHPTTTFSEQSPPSEHGSGFPPFDPSTFASQLIWLAIFFAALYVIASKLALPRVGSILSERRSRITGDLDAAARMKGEADAANSAYEKALAGARSRAQAIAGETRARLAARAEEQRKTLEASLHAKLAEADRAISATKSAAMANVRDIAQEAAAAIVTRLAGTAPAKAAVAAAVDATIKR
jgi:F-type H+-transporting ATPase subunit b